MRMANYKLNIFDFLAKLDSNKPQDHYLDLSDDEKKGMAPLIIMRWMSGTHDERQIMLLNEFVNPAVFALGRHPHLLTQLLHAASSKTPKRYYWLGVKGQKKNTETVRVISEYYEMSQREVALMSPRPSADELLDMAGQLGWQPDEVKKLKKEIDDN